MTSLADMKKMGEQVDRAYRDAVRSMIADLPDAKSYARWLETAYPDLAVSLMQAWRSPAHPYCGMWRVADDQHTRSLRLLGLVGWIGSDRRAGCAVGAFGMEVRQAMLGAEA